MRAGDIQSQLSRSRRVSRTAGVGQDAALPARAPERRPVDASSVPLPKKTNNCDSQYPGVSADKRQLVWPRCLVDLGPRCREGMGFSRVVVDSGRTARLH
jgi:hypothetical protein